MTDPGYATYRDPRLRPPEEPGEDALDAFGRCAHAAACERLWRRVVDARTHFGWMEDMARGLACDACEEMEE